MKIRNRLTLLYIAIAAPLLLCVNIYIYYFIDLHIKNDFFNRLDERAINTAQLFLEKDEIPPPAFKKIKDKYVNSLPDETVLLYDKNNRLWFASDTGKTTIPYDLLEKVRREKHAKLWDGERQLAGLFYQDNQGDFVVIVSAYNFYGTERIHYILSILTIGFTVSLVVLFFLGRHFSKIVLKPMSDIVQQASRIKATNLHLRINEGNGKDEIAELAITLNNLLARLEKTFETEKEFVHNASHELRTPLTAIIGEIEVALKKERSREEYRDVLISVLQEARQLSKLTTSLLQMAQTNIDKSELITELIRIDELLWEVRAHVSGEGFRERIVLEFKSLPKDSSLLVIKANKQLLFAAITNILENACKYSDGKPVKIILEIMTGKIEIIIIDQGIGIDEKDISQIFKSFYRGEKNRSYRGFGIGLALTEKIILLHEGNIKINSDHSGTVVRVHIPSGNLT